ncbi:SDR family oxidoreductase [Microtetraspora sp. AC03309]|uniref:SDR family oxidoreductase n=1 Tax=Microtetraspora sp. AC03309 TaxID=2779376 RepID=UPI001E56F474|nr:SDR family oxidoreductase [Microtetraspora sp. AC03309]MCC5577984.1 SDR family oxidoreductase [Microtetraspora sp. AC03309]
MTRKIAVSGSASGIGKALAELLREQGDEVIGVDLRDADVCADLSGPEGRALAVESVLRLSGGVLDGVVACAGVSAVTTLTVRVNHFGVVGLLEGLRPALAAAPAPRAAVVGSISGTQPVDPGVVAACLEGDEDTAVALSEQAIERGEGRRLYPSSKSALAKWLRRESVTPQWAGAGIPLNAIAPGVVLTPMSAPLFEDEAMRKAMEAAVPMPLNGHATAEVIAEALAWLVSPVNTHMTGQVIYVDGGAEATLRGPDVY